MKIVYLKWMDAASYSKREHIAQALEDGTYEVETAGFILRENRRSITVLQSLFHSPGKLEDEVDNYIVIPKGWILERKTYG